MAALAATGRAEVRRGTCRGGAGDWTQYVPEQWRAWLDASPAPRPQSRALRFIGVDEPEPGPRWQALFAETWPAYRALVARAGRGPAPGPRGGRGGAAAATCRSCVGVYDELVRLAGGDDAAAAMLALWNPPPFIVACSQAVVARRDTGEPVLLRNYDYDPRLFEATVLPLALGPAPRARHGRLPVGPGGRRERCRPGRVADVRRPPARSARASVSRW